jgi:hypothetical protein
MDVAIRFFQQTMKLLVSVAFLGSVLAHFDLVEPKGRIVNEETANEAPCGGVPTGNRTQLPLQGSLIGTTIFHKGTVLRYRISLKENPSQNDFVELLPQFTVEKASTVRTNPIDYTAVAGVKENVNAVVQIQSEDSHEGMYQCIDVTFIKKSSTIMHSISKSIIFIWVASLLL